MSVRFQSNRSCDEAHRIAQQTISQRADSMGSDKISRSLDFPSEIK
jgi:hypothetical protein